MQTKATQALAKKLQKDTNNRGLTPSQQKNLPPALKAAILKKRGK